MCGAMALITSFVSCSVARVMMCEISLRPHGLL